MPYFSMIHARTFSSSEASNPQLSGPLSWELNISNSGWDDAGLAVFALAFCCLKWRYLVWSGLDLTDCLSGNPPFLTPDDEPVVQH